MEGDGHERKVVAAILILCYERVGRKKGKPRVVFVDVEFFGSGPFASEVMSASPIVAISTR